jgi:hypothetical protein
MLSVLLLEKPSLPILATQHDDHFVSSIRVLQPADD